MRRRLLAALLAICMIGAFTGCGSKASDAGESAAATSESAKNASGAGAAEQKVSWTDTLTVPMLVGPLINDGVRNQIAAFEKKYNVSFEVEEVSDDNFETLITARAATGELNGLVDWHSGAQLNNLTPADNLMPVTGEKFLDNLEDIYRNSVTLNGQTYGVPEMPVYAGGMAYNKKIYSKLGLSVPKTWAEFISNCNAIKKAGYTAVLGSFDIKSTAQMIWLTDFYNVHTTYPNFEKEYTANKVRLINIPSYVNSFKKMADIATNKYYNEDYLSTNRDQAIQMLAEGKGAHYCLLTRELVNVLAANYPEAVEDIGFFATPGDDPAKTGITVWMPHSWYIAKNADDQVKEAGKLWMAYVTSQEGLDVYFAKQSMAGPVMVKNAKYPSNVATSIKEAIDYYSKGNWYPAQEFVTPVKGSNTPNICVEAASGAIKPEDAVQQIDKDNAKVAIQLGLDGWK